MTGVSIPHIPASILNEATRQAQTSTKGYVLHQQEHARSLLALHDNNLVSTRQLDRIAANSDEQASVLKEIVDEMAGGFNAAANTYTSEALTTVHGVSFELSIQTPSADYMAFGSLSESNDTPHIIITLPEPFLITPASINGLSDTWKQRLIDGVLLINQFLLPCVTPDDLPTLMQDIHVKDMRRLQANGVFDNREAFQDWLEQDEANINFLFETLGGFGSANDDVYEEVLNALEMIDPPGWLQPSLNYRKTLYNQIPGWLQSLPQATNADEQRAEQFARATAETILARFKSASAATRWQNRCHQVAGQSDLFDAPLFYGICVGTGLDQDYDRFSVSTHHLMETGEMPGQSFPLPSDSVNTVRRMMEDMGRGAGLLKLYGAIGHEPDGS